MDALMDHQTAVDEVVAGLLRPLIDQDLSLVFYDLTTIRAAGLSVLDDVRNTAWPRRASLSASSCSVWCKPLRACRSITKCLMATRAKSPTFMPTLKKVLARFAHIKRLIVVADRGLLSLDNIEELAK
jgi:hypothetical protein